MLQVDNVLPAVDVPEVKTGPSIWEQVKGMGFEDAMTTVTNSLVSFCFKLLIAIVVFYLGKFLIKRIYGLVYNVMTRRQVDASLTTFVLSLIRITLYFVLIIIAIGILGVETSSFIAIFASAGVAVGMALSGTLQNFAGGVLILLLKPYKVGDFIEVQGYTGTVKSIQLFNTVINTADNKAIIVPNGALSTSSINNYSLEDYRRVDWTVSLAYGTDFESAKSAILDIVNSDVRTVRKFIEDDIAYREKVAEEKFRAEHPDVQQEKKHGWLWRMFHKTRKALPEAPDIQMDQPVSIPQKVERAPFVGLQEMADSAIVLVVRAWTHSSNYWPVFYDLNRRFYTELPQKGFEFPFPQLDVHMNHQETPNT